MSTAEALAAADGGADIIDIKNVQEGSLGANFPWTIREVVQTLRDRKVVFSATLGDLSFKPGTAALAAVGAAACGVQCVKAGLYGVRDFDEARSLMKSVTRACREFDAGVIVVAAGYADYRRFGGIDPLTLVRVADAAGADVVMVDTAIKDGTSLFDSLSPNELEDFIGEAKRRKLRVGLAGSVRFDHLHALAQLRPDVVGVRGCVCSGHDRSAKIRAELVREFVAAARSSRVGCQSSSSTAPGPR
jgi:uncharacterized protein (UPF0264 family)